MGGKKYIANLFYIIKLTLPLMLLAGIMGAVAITLFPWQDMTAMFTGHAWPLLVAGAIVIACVGLFLPVPIAFDVAIVTALLAGGVPPLYAMILLYTLGIFSIYSFFIVWTGISRKVAVVLSGVLVVMGILSGVAVELYLKWDEANQQELFREFDLGEESSLLDFFIGTASAATAQTSQNPTISTAPESGKKKISISETKLNQASAPADKLFSRQYGEERGLVVTSNMSVSQKFITPFYHDWPVASADIDADGWIDLVFGSDEGVFLYKNIEGKRFEPIALKTPGEHVNAMRVALVDLNNDFQPDLFVSSYRGGNYIMYNDNGKFTVGNHQILPDLNSTVLDAVAFADMDLDGDIDIIAGNWMGGRWTRLPPENSRNAILWNDNNSYRIEPLEGYPGETLSILVSDINQDGYPDLLVGNDFQMAEFYYMGQPGGKLKLIKRSDNIFPITTFSTMSIDSGDIDNDLAFEIYSTQASGFTSTNPTNRASMLPLQSINITCREYEAGSAWEKRCLERVQHHQIIFEARQKRNPNLCLGISDEREKTHCVAYLLLEKSTRFDKNPKLCEHYGNNWKNLSYICKLGHLPPPVYTKAQADETLKQVLGRNMLYRLNAKGGYDELAEDMDVDITGWSWSARFADLDNDEWQDIYIVNGQFDSQKRATKVFFKNQQGRRFSNDTREAGLENYLAMSACTYIDYDNDGDLDIVAVSFDGPIWLYTNNTQKNAGIFFELHDQLANRAGIGSRIIIHYGENAARHQIREIKASGGFASFDAPRAHFGLGEHHSVSKVDIIWSTGEKTQLQGDFKAGHSYRITRASS